MGSKYATPYSQNPTVSANYTALSTDDAVTATATATALTVTLYNSGGFFGNSSKQGGKIRIFNSAASTNIVIVAAASGAIIGPTVIYPGQSYEYLGDGSGNWFNSAPLGALGQVQVALSAAQIIGMFAAPVTLIPAPPAGYVLLVESISFKMVTTATAFTGGGVIEFRYTNASGALLSATLAAAIVTAGAGTSYTSVAGVTTSLTNVANTPIVIDNATGAFAAGTGTAVVTILYRAVLL